MSLLFITGSNASFFPSLLITLQSFSERIPNQKILVCDYGLNEQQANFLRQKNQLLERPPTLPADTHYLACKAAMIRYLLYANYTLTENDTVIWIDADITFMGISIKDFCDVITEIKKTDTPIAVCPTGYSLLEICNLFKDEKVLYPFKNLIHVSNISPDLPYLSVGMFFCRSKKFLEEWDTLTASTPIHNMLEMNTFNTLIHREKIKYAKLDFEEWQANGTSLDKIDICYNESQLPLAFIKSKNIKTIHTTSSELNHILVTKGKINVLDVVLMGTFKLIMMPHLRQIQLRALATYIATNKTSLLAAEICALSNQPIEGFEFMSMPWLGSALTDETPDFQ